MSLPQQGECPLSSRGIALLSHGYEQVAAAFDGFVTHVPMTDRGGNVRAHKTPRAIRTDESTRLPGYHVESSFTGPQQAYVGLSVAALTKLARGEVLGAVDSEQPSLSAQIQSRFLDETETRLLFVKSMVKSTASLFENFGSLYPNLTPALEAIHKTGAAVVGTALAILSSQELLKHALTGLGQPPRYLKSQAPGASFTAAFPRFDDQKSYETWCPGEALAKTIIREAGMAASVLAQTSEVREAYDPYCNDAFTVGFPEIRQQIEESMQRAITAAHPASVPQLSERI